MVKKKNQDSEIDPDIAENLQRFLEKSNETLNLTEIEDDVKSSKRKPVGKTVLNDESPLINEHVFGEDDSEEYGVNPEDLSEEESEEESEPEEDIEQPAPKPKPKIDRVKTQQKDFYKKDRPKSAGQTNNPLQAYFREAKNYINLPSQGNFNDENDIDFSSSGEVAVYPLTAKDELWFKNPEALLNGDAIVEVLKSCVPGVKDIRNLPINDVNTLLIAVRNASYGNILQMAGECPHCKHKTEFGVDIEELLSHINFLEPEYVLDTDNGIRVYLQPHTYDITMRAMLLSFEESKLIQALSKQEVSDEEKNRVMRESFSKIQDLGFWLTSRSIVKVVTPDKKAIKNKDHILEWLVNINMAEYNRFKQKIDEINDIGVPKNWTIECGNPKCKKEFEIEIQYNPSNFFG